MDFRVLTRFSELDPAEYGALLKSGRAPVFYDPRLMLAAEQTPLLPPERVFYIVARDAGGLQAFLPCYLLSAQQIDPFGLLKRTASVDLYEEGRGLFSHIAHCYESVLLVRAGRQDLLAPMLARFRDLALELRVKRHGLVNVTDPVLMEVAASNGYCVNYMLDRYSMSLEAARPFDDYLLGLPREGRQELRRQLKKFLASDARVSVVRPDQEGLEALTPLVQETTARHGTPFYFPRSALLEFVRQCGALVWLVKVEHLRKWLGGFICLEEESTLHIWSGGFTYDAVDFSPYTIAFAEVYRHAVSRGFRRIEIGRLNARIKERMGYLPVPMYSIISRA
ncbi:GNAT family N-acetyltransferase [Myxococcus sp. AB025B]|uniref:GNAT family N-acetyltransferase n=1 Tax=Myxococcus sp. AB025B TaxID=2562794 RepID=UPI00114198FE|nr:GNAT family N-acetyltransferase [Myxococcus sp. AB025B]